MAKHKIKAKQIKIVHPRHIKARRWFASVIGVLGLAEGLVLMSNTSITGNVINETAQANYSILGSLIFLVGLVAAILALKKN
jgi:hypothetical protein